MQRAHDPFLQPKSWRWQGTEAAGDVGAASPTCFTSPTAWLLSQESFLYPQPGTGNLRQVLNVAFTCKCQHRLFAFHCTHIGVCRVVQLPDTAHLQGLVHGSPRNAVCHSGDVSNPLPHLTCLPPGVQQVLSGV